MRGNGTEITNKFAAVNVHIVGISDVDNAALAASVGVPVLPLTGMSPVPVGGGVTLLPPSDP